MANFGMSDDIGVAMATREFDSAAGPVQVEIGAPVRMPDGTPMTWMCGTRITGVTPEPEVTWAPGTDAIEALILALRIVGDRLDRSGIDLTWDGIAALGLPIGLPDGDIIVKAPTDDQLSAVLGTEAVQQMRERGRQLLDNVPGADDQ